MSDQTQQPLGNQGGSSWRGYLSRYQRSLDDTEAFWDEEAKNIDWFQPFTHVQTGDFEHGDIAWFTNGQLNASFNCIDRHLDKRADQVAILWEGDEPTDVRKITFLELHREVSRCANVLKRMGVRKGDCVCIYMPMVPEAAIAMLACSRIGAPHSVVFAGFSADALRDRILDGECKVVITSDEGRRGGRRVPLKQTVDHALLECPDVHTVLVHKRTGSSVPFKRGRDVWWDEAMARERPYCPAEFMDSEDTLFLLYTSGSTGKPKGIAHSTGGYLVYTGMTHREVFDYREGDVYACVADVGWITGHSYIVYGPLLNGATTFMFESTPLYPNVGRYWDMVQRHRITQFYTAPTAIRALMKHGEDHMEQFDLSSLRVLGSVGEPINPEAWRWYHTHVGRGRIPIVDTYWQTETGGIIITPIPGAGQLKPGSATFPFFGIEPVLMDKDGHEIVGNEQEGMLAIKRPWPGICRTVFGDHQRYLTTYMKSFPGYYFTGDGAKRDKDGYYWITGRVDDVLNISGHRIGTAEVESALVGHDVIAESAVVGVPHSVKGQSMFAYCIAVDGVEETPELVTELKLAVRHSIGAFASVDTVLLVPALPKTRSGKIMRRLLRKIACRETDSLGDVSTLADPAVVQNLIDKVNAMAS